MLLGDRSGQSMVCLLPLLLADHSARLYPLDAFGGLLAMKF